MKTIEDLWLAFTISGNEARWCLVGSWFGNVWLIRAGDSSIWTRLCCVTVFCNDLHFSVKRCICFHRRGAARRSWSGERHIHDTSSPHEHHQPMVRTRRHSCQILGPQRSIWELEHWLFKIISLFVLFYRNYVTYWINRYYSTFLLQLLVNRILTIIGGVLRGIL